MSKEAWQPSEIDKILAFKGYFKYASGVAVFNNPHGMTRLHAHEVNRENIKEITCIAEKLILSGLISIITYANPKEIRGDVSLVKNGFEDAFTYMNDTVNLAYAKGGKRLDKLNPYLPILRPAPMLDQVMYDQICEPTAQPLSIADLMDGIQTSPAFRNFQEIIEL